MYDDSFGRQFQEWRKRKGVTMMMVSKELRKPVSTLNAWILGYNQMPEHIKAALEQYQKEHDC